MAHSAQPCVIAAFGTARLAAVALGKRTFERERDRQAFRPALRRIDERIHEVTAP